MADEPPFRFGDPGVVFILHADRAVTVHTAYVRTCVPHGDGWQVTDNRGRTHEVDRAGEGSDFVPMDAELRQELTDRGEGFHAVEEGRIHEPPPLTQELTDQSLEQELGGSRDGIG